MIFRSKDFGLGDSTEETASVTNFSTTENNGSLEESDQIVFVVEHPKKEILSTQQFISNYSIAKLNED